MKNQPPAFVAFRLRTRYLLAGLIMLGLWGASLVAFFRGTDGIHIMMVALATITLLPLGVIAVWGAVSGNDAGMARARSALFAGTGLLALVVVIEMARRIIFGGAG